MEVSTIEQVSAALDMKERQDMKKLTKEQRERVKLKMAFMEMQMAELRELVRDDDDDVKPVEPVHTGNVVPLRGRRSP